MKIDRRAMLMGMAATPLIAAKTVPKSVKVFEARDIVTMDESLGSSPFRYMAVADGTILGLANRLNDLRPWTQGREVLLDKQFADKVLFPGLIDPHIHPMQAAVMLNLPFLAPDDWQLPSGNWPGLRTQAAYRARLAKLVQEDQSNPLICWGHHALFHGPLNKPILDEIAPDRPLFVWQRSFHEIIVNSAGLRSIGLGEESAFDAALKAANADPHHSSFADGVFSETGLLVAIGKLQSVLLTPERMTKGFRDLQAMMQARGVTTTSDMATGIFARFDTEAALISGHFGREDRMARAMLMPMAGELDHVEDLDAWLAQARRKFVRPGVGLDRRVKLFADGAFFAQNMRMGPPGYSDGHIGKWLTEPDKLKTQIKRYLAAKFSLHIHVNGDEGTEVVLDALEDLSIGRDQTITLEHLGYCTTAQIERIAYSGMMVSAQPNYIRVLGEAYSKSGLGPDRASVMNRLGTIANRYIPLGLHSDFNMAPIDPFYLAWIAEMREGLDGTSRAPEERLNRTQALRAITIDAAQVIGQNDQIGSLTAGKKADFIALDHDPFDVETDVLKALPIAATVFEGRVSEQ